MVLVFPSNPNVGDQFGNWQWDGRKWTNQAHGAVPEEAPHDGVTYGRVDESWEPVVRTDGSTPITGNQIINGMLEAGTTVAAGAIGLEVARDTLLHGKLDARGQTLVRTPLTGPEAANKDYVDAEIAGRKYASTITGNGSDREFDIMHSLGSQDVLVGVWDQTHKLVLTDVESTDPDEVMISFANPPATGAQFHVVVLG